jgi:hypothetical protein
VRSLFKRLSALALAALLLAGAVPVGAYAAMLIVPAETCPHHGRACTCPKACKRAKSEARAEPEDQSVPACHRKPASSKPKCTMSGCGGVEIPSFLVTAHDPYLGFMLNTGLAPGLSQQASLEPPRIPLSTARAPSPPPPRLLSTRIG